MRHQCLFAPLESASVKHSIVKSIPCVNRFKVILHGLSGLNVLLNVAPGHKFEPVFVNEIWIQVTLSPPAKSLAMKLVTVTQQDVPVSIFEAHWGLGILIIPHHTVG